MKMKTWAWLAVVALAACDAEGDDNCWYCVDEDTAAEVESPEDDKDGGKDDFGDKDEGEVALVYGGQLDLADDSGSYTVEGDGCLSEFAWDSVEEDTSCDSCEHARVVVIGSATSDECGVAEFTEGVSFSIGHVAPDTLVVLKEGDWGDAGSGSIEGDVWTFTFGASGK